MSGLDRVLNSPLLLPGEPTGIYAVIVMIVIIVAFTMFMSVLIKVMRRVFPQNTVPWSERHRQELKTQQALTPGDHKALMKRYPKLFG